MKLWSGFESMATSQTLFELKNLGNVALKGNNLIFQLQFDRGDLEGTEKVESFFFMCTFVKKDVSKTLGNIQRSALQAGVIKQDLAYFMKEVSGTLPQIYSSLSEEKEEETKKPKASTPSDEMLADAKKEAERILNSLNPLDEIALHLSHVISGELENAKRLFLKCVATRTEDKRVKWIILITGESGAGKSTLMNLVKALTHAKEVGRLTRHALDYMELIGYDVLILKEIGQLDNEDEGVSTLKFLSIDDDGYTVEVPARDPDTGQMSTKPYRIPPINVISSSTRVSFDNQFERRTELLNPDDSVEQTKKVKEFKGELERQEILQKWGMRKYKDRDFSLEVLRAVLRLIEDIRVEIPFPTSLNPILTDEQIRARGDFDKLFANIRLYHLLSQRNLHVEELNGERIIFATPTGTVQAVRLFREPFEAMLSGIDKRTRQIIQAMRDLRYAKNHRISMNERSEIAEKTNKDPKTIYSYMERLYRDNKLLKGKEGESQNSPVFYILKKAPREMLSSSIISDEKLGNDLFHSMWNEGMTFLLKEVKLSGETIEKIRATWKTAFLTRTINSNHARFDKIVGIDRLYSDQSMDSTPNQNQSSNHGDHSRLIPEPSAGGASQADQSQGHSPDSRSFDLTTLPQLVYSHWGPPGIKLPPSLYCDICHEMITTIANKAKDLLKKHIQINHPNTLSKDLVSNGNQSRNLLEIALSIFKKLDGGGDSEKRNIEDNIYKDELVKTGEFNAEDAEKMLQTMIRSGQIYEVRPHFYTRI